MNNLEKLLLTAIHAAIAAGKEILDVYHTDFDVEHKKDQSPLTLADKRAHETIVRYLKPLGIPILSEEGKSIPYAERKQWDQLWIVDPLDGTKEFIKKNDEFTVNIALITQNTPDLGIVYVPVKDNLYFGAIGMGSYKLASAGQHVDINSDPKLSGNGPFQTLMRIARKLPLDNSSRTVFTVMGSRSHPSPALDDYIEKLKQKHDQIEFISAGSSLKICKVAEGAADLYPRLGPTMEWDTAAGHAVVKFAGMVFVEYETNKALTYNKEDLLNPWFVVKKQ